MILITTVNCVFFIIICFWFLDRRNCLQENIYRGVSARDNRWLVIFTVVALNLEVKMQFAPFGVASKAVHRVTKLAICTMLMCPCFVTFLRICFGLKWMLMEWAHWQCLEILWGCKLQVFFFFFIVYGPIENNLWG